MNVDTLDRIRAALSPDGLKRLRLRVSPARVEVIPSLPREIEDALRRGERTPVVVDPAAMHEDAFHSLTTMTSQVGSGLLIYAQCNRLSVVRSIQAAHSRTVEVLFFGSEDEDGLLLWLLRTSLEASAPARVMRKLAPSFRRLNPAAQEPAVSLLGWSPIAPSAGAFVAATGAAASTVEDWLHDANIRGIRPLLRGAGLARGWHALARHARLDEVVAIAGLKSVRALENAFDQFTGLTARRASRNLDTAEFTDALVTGMTSQIPPEHEAT
jgi:hypothetical protein